MKIHSRFFHSLKHIIAMALVLTVLLASSVGGVFAQQDNTGSGLSISPVLVEKTLEVGEASTIDISLKNITVVDITAQASINDFTADNETGSPRILTNNEDPSPYSIRTFITELDDVPLAVGEQKNLKIPVQIPQNTAPGAYFGVIRYRAVPVNAVPPGEGEVALSASVGTIVLITVPGTITEQVQLTSFKAYAGEQTGTFFTSTPTEMGIEIKNLGSGFVKPFGTVEIRDIFGNVVYTYEVNQKDPRANVLPNSTRLFKDKIENVNKPSRYTATANISYGTGSEILVSKTTFWYLPAWLLAIISALLLALIIAVGGAFRRYRRGSRHYRRHR